MTQALVTAATQADGGVSTGVGLLAAAAGLAFALLCIRAGTRRARRDLAAAGIPAPTRHNRAQRRLPPMPADQVRARRSLRGYLRWIVDAPAFRLRLAAVLLLALSTLPAAGPREALMAAGVILFVAFPLGYLAWRQWWWRTDWLWDRRPRDRREPSAH